MSTAADLLVPRTNPYPLYAELRNANDGVHYIEPIDTWVMLRYADGQRLARERRRWSSDYFGVMLGQHDPENPVHQRYAQVMSRNLMMNDAPDHSRLRGLLNHAFVGRAVRAWDPVIQEVLDIVLDSVPVGEEFDAFSMIGEVIPVGVITRLIGVPFADRERFRRLSVAFASSIDPLVVGEERDQVIRESVELFDYVRELAQDRSRESGDDLLSTLIQAEEDGSKLDMDELVAQVCMLLVAGNETTADLITTGLALLLQHPDQLALVRDDPTLIDSAMLEVLRYESPLQFSPRLAAEDIDDVGDSTIPKGSRVFFGHGSANHDPRQFERPDEFDIRRGDRSHLAFAAGPHFCIGNGLALAEGKAFFRDFFARFDNVTLAGDPELRLDRFIQRGYKKLPLKVGS